MTTLNPKYNTRMQAPLQPMTCRKRTVNTRCFGDLLLRRLGRQFILSGYPGVEGVEAVNDETLILFNLGILSVMHRLLDFEREAAKCSGMESSPVHTLNCQP